MNIFERKGDDRLVRFVATLLHLEPQRRIDPEIDLLAIHRSIRFRHETQLVHIPLAKPDKAQTLGVIVLL